MKRQFTLLALGAFALLPLSLSQPASAHGYFDRHERLERRLERDRAALHHDYAERNYYAARERADARHGNYFGAQWFFWRRRHEDREIAYRRADIHRDYERLEHRGY